VCPEQFARVARKPPLYRSCLRSSMMVVIGIGCWKECVESPDLPGVSLWSGSSFRSAEDDSIRVASAETALYKWILSTKDIPADCGESPMRKWVNHRIALIVG